MMKKLYRQRCPKDQMSHVNKVHLNPNLFTLRCKGIGHNDRMKNMCLIFLDNINKGASNLAHMQTNEDFKKALGAH